MKARHDMHGLDRPPMGDEIWVHEFSEESAREFRMQVLDRAKEGNVPIIVYIDSYGGNADSLSAMIATMDSVPNAFITVAMGKAVSCGAILLSHGQFRYCHKYARVMIHHVWGGMSGPAPGLKNDVAETSRLNEMLLGLFATNCGMSGYDEFKSMLLAHGSDDLWMSAEEAVKRGVVDFVGLPELVPHTVYQCVLIPDKERIPRPKHNTKAKTKSKGKESPAEEITKKKKPAKLKPATTSNKKTK